MKASTPAKLTTVHSLLSPEDASKLSGRYETTAEVKGKSVSVLRSIRQANAKGEELVVSGSITPKKKAPAVPSAEELDCLCDLFSSKARVTPKKKKPASKKKVAKAEEAKENAGGDSKKKTKKTARFGDLEITVHPVSPACPRGSSRAGVAVTRSASEETAGKEEVLELSTRRRRKQEPDVQR